MKKNPASVLFAAIQLTAAFSVFAQTGAAVNSFIPLDIDSDNRLLFNIREDFSSNKFDSLFLSKIEEKPSQAFPTELTACPEQMELLDGGSSVLIRNRYGSTRINMKKNTVEWTANQEKSASYSGASPASASPDGKWLCFLRASGKMGSQIILQDASNGREAVLCDECRNEYDRIPVKWAPDSKTVLYEKNGMVYFATPESMFRPLILSEEMRVIGSGSINCVSWTKEKFMLYVHDDIIYKIYENELYNRAMYAPVVGYGTIVARLPYLFDCERDRLWASQDGKSFVTITGQNIVTYFSCVQQGLYFATVNSMFPIPASEGSVVDASVFWNKDKKPYLWVESIGYDNGGRSSSAYSVEDRAALKVRVKNAGLPKVSPDGKKIAFASESSFQVYDFSNWKKLVEYGSQTVKSFCWSNSSSIILGGERRICEWNTSSLKESFLHLSSAETACFSGGKILANDSVRWYEYIPETGSWTETNLTGKKQSQTVSNGRYRAYSAGSYINIRSLSGSLQTYPLFASDLQAKKQSKKIAIVFDAMENADGLAKVLSDIEKFGIKTTFFINGEFIRRYPLETKQLAFAGIECGSSFYSSADLLSPMFGIDGEFIKRGLARNEDEFLAATGKELSLLWHAPNYKSNEMMRKAGDESGYTYVEAEPLEIPSSSSSIIQDLVNGLVDGKIISLTVGKNTGKENTYLTEHLDLLFSSILKAGWEICPLQELLEGS